jgi:endonuclease/exonuclease/phosphatase family metal-dependent hydrolase
VRAVLTVMTWNVENFFAPQPADQAAFEAKLAALAEVIGTAAPDLLAVQEVGDEQSFQALRAALGAGWTGVLSTHFETPHTIRVGWLSPTALSDVAEVVDLPAALSPVKVDDDGATLTQLGRGALAVTYTTPSGTAVRALTAHLKSKLLSFPGGRFDTSDESERVRYGVYALDRRAAEAAAVRDWASSSLAGDWADQPLVVCGDLNDTMDAATTQLIFGPPGSQIGTGGFAHPDHGDPQRLWDLGYAMSPPNDFSRINQGRPELIDHILISHAMIGHLTDGATVPLEVPSIGVRPQGAPRTDPPSDHRPVLAHFDLSRPPLLTAGVAGLREPPMLRW